jgi:hypothetical protein
LVPIPKKKVPRKKVIVVKDKDEKSWKNWLDGEVLHLIALRGEMELEFVINAKRKNRIR